jgi:pimeloyl-ACP methyl ester carboxylesterase
VSPPDAAQFSTHRATVGGVEIAFAREGAGGYPLLLVHGWPETRRIWWRNIAHLAAAGFEVIAPDLRGFGDSGLAPDERYDTVAHSHDMEALVRGELGHERCVVCAGDLGGVVAQDLSLRFEGLVERMVLFNTIPPLLPEEYAAAGIPAELPRVVRQAADYFLRQSRDADGLAAELDTPEKRRRYVAQMYGPRFWAAPGAFSRDDTGFMTEPFGDAGRFRASIANYEYVGGARTAPETPRMLERNPLPALVLHGPEDHVIPADFPDRMEVAFPEIVGPFTVPGAGHFLMWERPRVLNRGIEWFCRDLLAQSPAE